MLLASQYKVRKLKLNFMQIHNLQRKNKNKKSRIVGRGGKRGKTSGRGTKGQNARAGHKKRPEIRDIIKKLPKKRGYKFSSIKIKPKIVNLQTIEKFYLDKQIVSPATLVENKILSRASGKLPKVKILGKGELKKKINIQGCLVSRSVKIAIEKAGGVIMQKSKIKNQN